MSSSALEQVKAATKARVEAGGYPWSEEVWKRAKAKAARWLRTVYRSKDWQTWLDECGDDIFCHWTESIEKAAPGDATHNRTELNRGRAS
jgi:hypothetical protein